ncbi:hypothetical protein [Bremerella sp. P1]|uniref:hypothetical protein n=1 Tax=Bremerella sp. P1 TaxID=3026424 RepID=UPI0023684B95|nr:hypothetical protein [Bremerella sp. P1]WDI40517.1 hypothetical protein PSR63_18745 [Bremerella sp. P1]
MKTFKDNADRTWTVTVNVDAIKRVRSLLNIDLMEAVEGKLIERLIGDPILLCDVIYCVCKEDADAKGITDEEFGRAMAGDAIELATTALLEELVDFFPQGKRQLLRKALAKLETLQETMLAVVSERLDSPELDAQLLAELRRLGDSSGDSPASSESTPVS